MLEAISSNMEGVHVGFLIQVMGWKAKWQRYGIWVSAAAVGVFKEAGNHKLGMYVDK